ncbi:hypothetical protein SS50377_26829 [Spironucleus salmonicida]|uniref:Thioredoxin-like domain-containing protein n=1 Tax=Spironucleus salmonicida TaxID=348837 RepID=V6LYH3_9EUKA|nr:hypothetical protein SS50377_26829 [Spironucleus salmonicida]|eukprot:EST49298.1 Hypothetical protein SS50377_10521 [Spironucleus salmonicida]
MFNIKDLLFVSDLPPTYSPVAMVCFSTTSPEARQQITYLSTKSFPANIIFATLDSVSQITQIANSHPNQYFATDKDQKLRAFLERNVPKLQASSFTFILVNNKVVWKGSVETDDFAYWIDRVSTM